LNNPEIAVLPNNSMQLTALRTAADAGREAPNRRMATIHSSPASEASGHLHRPRDVERIVAIIQRVYALVIVSASLLVLLLLVSTGPSFFSLGQWACVGLGFEAMAVTYLGLRSRKPWVLPLIVFSSAYTLIPCAADRPATVVAIIISRGGAFFALSTVVLHSSRHDVVFQLEWKDVF
jgi:hypothetical protein